VLLINTNSIKQKRIGATVELMMLKSRMLRIGEGLFFCVFFSLFAACGGGGGSDENRPSDATVQTHTLAVQATVTFPASSPLDSTNASVLCNEDFSPLDSSNQAKIEITTNEVMDVTLFLPSRDGVEGPTVYLNTTVVPGDAEVNLNIEETAISLVMTGVDHRFLEDPTMASWVKSVVRKQATDFIDDLDQKMASDPYLLRPDNIATALGPLFTQAVADSDAALEVIYDQYSVSSASTMKLSGTGSATDMLSANSLVEIPDGAQDFGDFYVKYDRSTPLEQFVFLPPGSIYDTLTFSNNSMLRFMNSSMLPVLTRITDTHTAEVIKELPTGTFAQAFSSDILSPTNGPFGLPLPSFETIDNGTRNIQVEVFTPGISDFLDSSYFESGSPCGPLLARASFSGAIMPLVGVILPSLPSNVTNSVTETIFSVLQRADVFENILNHWPYGRFQEGLSAVYDDITANWGANTNIASEIIEALVEKGYLNSTLTPELAARLGVKVATAELAVAAAGISIAALAEGLVETPSKVVYQLVYPLGLHDLEPGTLQKISEGDVNSQEFTLTGHGLAGFSFDGEFHTARLMLEAFNKDHEKLEEAWLDEDFGLEIESGDEVDTITFKLPDAWVGVDTEINHVRLTLQHGYVAPGWLGSYTSWTNYLEEVELPASESMVNKFTIHLTQDLKITGLDSTVLEKGGLVKIRGEGFAGDESGLENEVYFLDKDGSPFSASIMTSSETYISAYVPLGLQLNDSTEPETIHVGSTYVYVALSDGAQSNQVWVAVVPEPPMISPGPVAGQMDYKGTEISMLQTSNFPIYYTVDDSVELSYNGPFDLEETCEIRAYAKVLVDGVFYTSSETTQNYITCQEGETFIPYPHGAQCVVLQNVDLIPRRYCPLYSSEYTDPIVTEFGLATCSYSWLTGGTSELAKETHRDSGQTTAYSVTQFWAEPVGRPSYVWRPTASYHFCPDGSFGTACSH
jgi:hypothetical protein